MDQQVHCSLICQERQGNFTRQVNSGIILIDITENHLERKMLPLVKSTQTPPCEIPPPPPQKKKTATEQQQHTN